jgi:hypothetical protein
LFVVARGRIFDLAAPLIFVEAFQPLESRF